jgi:hypothetical protein
VILAHELAHKSKEAGMFTGEDVWDIAFSPGGNHLAIGFSKYEI